MVYKIYNKSLVTNYILLFFLVIYDSLSKKNKKRILLLPLTTIHNTNFFYNTGASPKSQFQLSKLKLKRYTLIDLFKDYLNQKNIVLANTLL